VNRRRRALTAPLRTFHVKHVTRSIPPHTIVSQSSNDARRDSVVGEAASCFFVPPLALMARILCLGVSALDSIYRVARIPATPTKVLATGFTECGGGMAANASVAVARLGGQSHYWGRVGDDELGRRILQQLAAEGVTRCSPLP
jgi:hypothetical protein